MKKRFILTMAAVLLCAAAVSAQADRYTSRDVDVDPALIPATPTAVWTFTVYVEEMTLTNASTNDVTCTIQDRQSTPRVLFSDTIGGKGTGKSSHYVMRYNGRKMPGGVTWSCTDGAAVVGYIQGKR
jgi:hypothetical protein